MRKHIVLIAVTLISVSNLFSQSQAKPNIVLFFSDDAGYADFGFTGSEEFRTPNIDELASEGIVCTNAYVSASVCGPSRAGLLTGRYQQRFGFSYNNVPAAIDIKAGLFGDKMGLPQDQLTIANYLKNYGYTSSIIGKWHQGHGEGFHPLDRGFDHFYGFLGGMRNYFESKKTDDETRLWHKREKIPEPEGYFTDHLADEACRFIENHQEDPFFLYLAFNAVHTPNQAKEADLTLFKKLEGNRKKLAAMTWSMDEAIGKVCKQLDKLGLEENTLIIFTNDNGGYTPNGNDNSPFSGCKATFLEGGIRVPFIIKWSNHLGNGTYHNPIITLDIIPTAISIAGGDAGEFESLDGVNILPYLAGFKSERPHQTLYWNGDGPFSAIRDVDWKLIKMPDRPPELYNLAEDPSERNNLSGEYPEITKSLLKKLYAWENVNDPPRWQLLKKYEKICVDLFDAHRK